MKDQLEAIFGTVSGEKEGEYSVFRTNDFRIDVEDGGDEFLVSVDLKSCFNKVSQSPIHFILPLSKRKEKRVKEALNFLLARKKEAGTFWGRLEGFDDVDESNRSEFWRNKSKKRLHFSESVVD